jgi:hypothetical protein
MRSFLDLDVVGPESGDAEYRCGEIRCLTAARHDFLIQGAHIGWTQNEKETGFTVTFPNKTAENQKRTQRWIQEEIKAGRARIENQTPARDPKQGPAAVSPGEGDAAP